MALEGANIIGQAQVYNQTQNAVNQYARTLQQQQLQRDRESKALSDELSKVKVDGIRQPDIPEFTTKYQEAKDIFAKRIATRDNAERIRLDLDLKTKMLELNQIAEDSKGLARGESQINNILIDPNKRDGFTEDAVTRVQKSRGLSRNDPNFIRDFTTLEQQVDLSAIMKELDKRDKNIIGQAQWVQSSEAGTQGNRKGVNVFDMRQADPKQQAIEYASFFDTSPKFRNAVRKMYPQFSELPNAELKAMAIPELVNQRPKVEYGKPNFEEDRDDRAYNLSLRRENRLASGEGDGGTNPNDFTVQRVELVTQPIYNDNGEEMPNTRKLAVVLDKSVVPKSTAFPSTYIKSAYNVDKGTNQPLDARQDLKLAKIGWTKVKGGQYELRAVVVDKDNATYLISENEIPIDVRNTKNYKVARQALGSAPSTPATQVKPTNTKATSHKTKGGIPFTVQ